jgi:membrane-associated phospholipid phosphatase
VSTKKPITKPAETGQQFLLPPYGYVNATYAWDNETRRVPDAFAVAGRAATPKEWRSFVDGITTELAEFLWPKFDQSTQTWIGRADASKIALTVADLSLLRDVLLPKLFEPVGPSDPKKTVTNKSMFQDEDETKPGLPYPTLDLYLPKVPVETLNALKDAIKKSVVGFGPAPLRFKELFQRPRPYQAAFMLNHTFAFELARSSMTPSMLSGHCLTGLIGRCAGFMTSRLRHQLEDVGGAVVELQQYAVDVGDRRVFAGVHYPSDNIGSWFVALRLCDHMFGEAGQVAKGFMREAISRSAVFIAITAVIRADAASPFALPMQKLDAEMKRTAARTEP